MPRAPKPERRSFADDRADHPFYVEPVDDSNSISGTGGVQLGVYPFDPQLYIGSRDVARRIAFAILEMTDPPDLQAMMKDEAS